MSTYCSIRSQKRFAQPGTGPPFASGIRWRFRWSHHRWSPHQPERAGPVSLSVIQAIQSSVWKSQIICVSYIVLYIYIYCIDLYSIWMTYGTKYMNMIENDSNADKNNEIFLFRTSTNCSLQSLQYQIYSNEGLSTQIRAGGRVPLRGRSSGPPRGQRNSTRKATKGSHVWRSRSLAICLFYRSFITK